MECVMNNFGVFMNEVTKFFIEQVKDVYMIIQICSSEEVCGGILAGVF